MVQKNRIVANVEAITTKLAFWHGGVFRQLLVKILSSVDRRSKLTLAKYE